MPSTFTHLEVRSHYSLLAGTASVDALAARAASAGMSHLALTDHNVLYGAVAFADACRRHSVEPILGMSVDVARPEIGMALGDEQPGRLLLLAQGPAGYRSLSRLSSWLQREGGSEPQVGWERLRQEAAGLLCVEAGRAGWLYRLLQAEQTRAAARYLSRLGAIFEGRGYVGLTLQGEEGNGYAAEVVSLGQRFGLPAVALQPVYCLEPDERPLLRLLAAMATGYTVETVPASSIPGGDDPGLSVHWLSPAEMESRFAAFPEALANVAELAARCQPALPDGPPLWPALELPQGESPDQALAAAAAAGLHKRYGASPAPAVHERLQQELTVIAHHGFASLFLVVADIVRFARAEQIPVSTRGSVANSLVAYCLAITGVDPVAHDLLFARFLNPARRSLPDIDLDFCSRERERVLAYVRRRYGQERVGLVGSMHRMRPRLALREAAGAYGYSEAAMRQLSSRLPRRERSAQALLALAAEVEGQEREVMETAARLVGQPHHLSAHPGGLVITPGPLQDAVPLGSGANGVPVTQFDQKEVEAIGLPKIDLLGIRALTVLAEAAALVRAERNPGFNLEGIAHGDERTAALLQRGETVGVFQCESDGARRTLRQLQARTVGDLAVANAFFKPGPATSGMAQHFIRRYRGEEALPQLHPAVAAILEPTKGVLLFQEQVLRLAREVAGLSWTEAEQLRRGVDKLSPRLASALRLQFVVGCQRAAPDGPGMTAEEADALWEQLVAFAGYAFNQGHALAYAAVSYRSAYLKAHYPAEFLCARLAAGGGFYQPAVYVAEAIALGIAVRPPHVNRSGRRWRLHDEEGEPGLWMGLGAVRGLRQEAVEALVDAAPFAGLRDLLARVALRAGEVRHLIRAGALDGLGESRSALLAEAENLLRAGNSQQLSFAFAAPQPVPAERAGERLAWELQLLGLPLSSHPLQARQAPIAATPLRRLPDSEGRRLSVAGVRLPGYTGGPGFFLWDGDSYVTVRGAGRPRAWQLLRLHGRWRQDRYGWGWFEAEAVEPLDAGG